MSKGASDDGKASNEPRKHNPETVAARQARAGMPRVRTGPQCVATSTSSGKQCKNAPIKGGAVCRKHGGATKHVRERARQRMLEMVWPALAQLDKIIRNPVTTDGDRIRAIREVLDRAADAGLGRNASIDVNVDSIWAQLDNVELVRDDGTPEIEADDATRLELERQVEDWTAEREDESEPLDHGGHQVVRGEVVEPTGHSTTAPPPWTRRAVTRRAR